MDQALSAIASKGHLGSYSQFATTSYDPGSASLVPLSNPNSTSSDIRNDIVPRTKRAHVFPWPNKEAISPFSRQVVSTGVESNEAVLRLAQTRYHSSQDANPAKQAQKYPAMYSCTLCPKLFTRAYNLRSHMRTHTDERPFLCTVCGKAFTRQHDRKRHESLHSGHMKFVCKGDLRTKEKWGCGREFARSDALARHLRSGIGRKCIKAIQDDEERWQRLKVEESMQQNLAQNLIASAVMVGTEPWQRPPVNGSYSLLPSSGSTSWSAPDAPHKGYTNPNCRSSSEARDHAETNDSEPTMRPTTLHANWWREYVSAVPIPKPTSHDVEANQDNWTQQAQSPFVDMFPLVYCCTKGPL